MLLAIQLAVASFDLHSAVSCTRRAPPWSSSIRMKCRVGVLGLPNVGKSTLFNSLARQAIAQVENFPFCTIEANVAPIAVPDVYLHDLGSLAGSRRTVPATMDWVDVAGLVRGASRGEGLGNRFLAVARECDAICHVVRAFDDANIIHVDGRVKADPLADAEVVNLELILADLQHVERRLEKTTCTGEERETLESIAGALREGKPARVLGLAGTSLRSVKSMGLLTLKPVLCAHSLARKSRTRSPAPFTTVRAPGPLICARYRCIQRRRRGLHPRTCRKRAARRLLL